MYEHREQYVVSIYDHDKNMTRCQLGCGHGNTTHHTHTHHRSRRHCTAPTSHGTAQQRSRMQSADTHSALYYNTNTIALGAASAGACPVVPCLPVMENAPDDADDQAWHVESHAQNGEEALHQDKTKLWTSRRALPKRKGDPSIG